MRISLVAVIAACLVCATATAQTATLLKQHRVGAGVPAANYSGITHLYGNKYAVVSDKEAKSGFRIFTIDIDTLSGRVRSVVADTLRGVSLAAPRDDEGICFCPDTGTLFISGEEDQQILEYDTLGRLTGRKLAVPDMFGRKYIQNNFGFESLAYQSAEKRFYTVTEGALLRDGDSDSRALRLLAFDANLQCVAQYAYRMEKLEMRASNHIHLHGVAELAALSDGRIVVLEREVRIPKRAFGSKVRCRLFLINPSEAKPITPDTDLQTLPAEIFLQKTELAAFSTRFNGIRLNYANYEGMCTGPRLADGRQTLLLIDDTQAGAGNRLFRLREHIKVIVF